MTADTTTVPEQSLPAPDERPEADPSWSRESRQLAIALAAALILHLLPVAFVLGKAVIGSGAPGEDEIGDPRGDTKGVNVEMIDASEFNEKYTSYGKGKAETSTQAAKPPAAAPAPQQPPAQLRPPIQEAVPQKQAQQQPTEQKAVEQKQAEPKPEPKEPVADPSSTPSDKPEQTAELDTPGLAPPPPRSEPKAEPKPIEQAKEVSPAQPPTPKMSESEIAEAFEEAKKAQVEGAAGLARSGRVSEFSRSVQRKLYMATPVFSNERGSVTVFLIIGDKGEIALLRIIKSSGNPTIDNAVITGIRTQRFIAPPPGTLVKERAVLATYEY